MNSPTSGPQPNFNPGLSQVAAAPPPPLATQAARENFEQRLVALEQKVHGEISTGLAAVKSDVEGLKAKAENLIEKWLPHGITWAGLIALAWKIL